MYGLNALPGANGVRRVVESAMLVVLDELAIPLS
jgi:hypothetical protein